MRNNSMKLAALVFISVLLASCGGGGGGGAALPGGGDVPGGGGSGSSVPSGSGSDRIFYIEGGSSGNFDLYEINGDNTGKRQVSFKNDTAVKQVFGISPDGNIVYFYGFSPTIYSVPFSNPTAVATKLLVSSVNPKVITPDSRLIYTKNSAVYSIKVDGSQALGTALTGTALYTGLTDSNCVIYSDATGLYSISSAATDSTAKVLLDGSAPNVYSSATSSNLVVYTRSSGIYKVDSSAALPSPVQLHATVDIPSIIKISGNYAFYRLTTGLYSVNLTGTPNPVQLTTNSADSFIMLTPSPDSRVLFTRSTATQDDIYSVNLVGTPQTPVALANSSYNDTFWSVTPDNRVIIETDGAVSYYNTIISVKSDGTGLLTLASGTNAGPSQGGEVEAVTPNGWVIYLKGSDMITETGVKADNTARGTFDNWSPSDTGITSDNRIISLDINSSSGLQLETIDPVGTNRVFMNTGVVSGYQDEFDALVVY